MQNLVQNLLHAELGRRLFPNSQRSTHHLVKLALMRQFKDFAPDPRGKWGASETLRKKRKKKKSKQQQHNTSIKYYSELPSSGVITWSSLASSPDGSVRLEPQGVDWRGLMNSLNSMEILEHQGWAVGQVAIPATGRYVVHCSGLRTVYVRRGTHLVPLASDQYSSGLVRSVVSFTQGKRELYAHVRAKVSTQWRCSVEPAAGGTEDALALLRMSEPPWLPDVVDGHLMGGWISVPILNTGTEWVGVNVSVSLAQATTQADGVEVGTTTPSPGGVGPGQFTFLPVHLQLVTPTPTTSGAKKKRRRKAVVPCPGVPTAIKLVVAGHSQTLSLRCRAV